jgi:hypothetical protein
MRSWMAFYSPSHRTLHYCTECSGYCSLYNLVLILCPYQHKADFQHWLIKATSRSQPVYYDDHRERHAEMLS